MVLKKYRWTIASKNRTKILLELDNKRLIPTQIAEKTEINRNNVSTYLRDLRDKNLITCLFPEQKKGRLYELTEDGNKVVTKIKKNG